MTREENQKAIDAVERLNALKQFIGYDKDSEIVQATQESLDMAIKALEQRWIPVSERLPEPKKDVVVWTIQGNEPRFFVAALFPNEKYGYCWIGEEEIHLYPEQVLYWMPLPDPPVEVKE